MIIKWLLKHRWVLELGKLLAAGMFFSVAYVLWLVRTNDGDFGGGAVAGVMITIVIMFLSDIACSIPKVIKRLKYNRLRRGND